MPRRWAIGSLCLRVYTRARKRGDVEHGFEEIALFYASWLRADPISLNRIGPAGEACDVFT
jgi:hypothetical protein